MATTDRTPPQVPGASKSGAGAITFVRVRDVIILCNHKPRKGYDIWGKAIKGDLEKLVK